MNQQPDVEFVYCHNDDLEAIELDERIGEEFAAFVIQNSMQIVETYLLPVDDDPQIEMMEEPVAEYDIYLIKEDGSPEASDCDIYLNLQETIVLVEEDETLSFSLPMPRMVAEMRRLKARQAAQAEELRKKEELLQMEHELRYNYPCSCNVLAVGLFEYGNVVLQFWVVYK